MTSPQKTNAAPRELTNDQSAELARLDGIISSLGLSRATFCKGSGYSESVLSRLLRDAENGYKTTLYQGDLSTALVAFRKHSHALVKSHAAAAGLRQEVIHETTERRDLMNAVTVAGGKAMQGSEDRLVTFVARSGHGKSTNARWLIEELGGVLVTASPSWRVGYSAMLATLCRAVGVPERERGGWGNCTQAEQGLLARLKERPLTLHIQELSPLTIRASVLESLKLLLNETRCVIVLYVVPEFRRALVRIGGETAAQLLRRGKTIVAQDITSGQALAFLKEHWSPEGNSPEGKEVKAAASALAKAANEFGGHHLLREVVNWLADDHADAPAVSAVHVEEKVTLYRTHHHLAA